MPFDTTNYKVAATRTTNGSNEAAVVIYNKLNNKFSVCGVWPDGDIVSVQVDWIAIG